MEFLTAERMTIYESKGREAPLSFGEGLGVRYKQNERKIKKIRS